MSLAAQPEKGGEAPLSFWARGVVDTDVDKQRPDLPMPDWVDTDALLGPPDGKFARLVIHNGWNDGGSITLDLGAEVGWGDLVLVYKQIGPGHARSITLWAAGRDKHFWQVGRAKLSTKAATAAFPIDAAVRYVRVGGFAGGAVGIDSTWYFDAVGVRTGRAALSRLTPLRKRAEALRATLADLTQRTAVEHRQHVTHATVRLDRQRKQLDHLADVPSAKVRETLTSVGVELDKLDAMILRLAALPMLSTSTGGKLPPYVVSWAPAMAKIRPAHPLTARDLRATGQVSLARHEHEAIQLVLAAGDADLRDVRVTVGPLKHVAKGHVIPAEHVTIERLGSVLIGGARWPDPILPLGSPTVPAGKQQSLWVRLYAPRGTPDGEYRSAVQISAKDVDPIELHLRVRVYDFDLPIRGHTAHIISCGSGGICDVALAHRATTGGGPCTGSIAEPKYLLRKDGSITMDFTEYDQVMQMAFDLGLVRFGLPISGGDGGGLLPSRLRKTFRDEATGKDVEVSMNPLEGEQARARMIAWLRCYTKHLREKGWFDRCFFYLWDEPNLGYGKSLLAIGRTVRQAVPDLKIMVVQTLGEAWHEVVDIYCPHVPFFGHRNVDKTLAAYRDKGIEMWWYNCGDPYPYPTYSIPHPAACARMSFLLMWKYGLTGNLYWASGVNNDLDKTHGKNVGSDGRGDGQLVYIHKGRRVPSLRLEMIRDGAEDYEYLWLLRERVARAKERGLDVSAAEKLLTIPPEVAVSVSKYSHDPDTIGRYRDQVARAIEGLGRSSKGE